MLHKEISRSLPSQPLYINLQEWVVEMVPGLKFHSQCILREVAGHCTWQLSVQHSSYSLNGGDYRIKHLAFCLDPRIMKPQSSASAFSGF